MRPTDLWIVEPTDSSPTQAFAQREGAGEYLAAITGPFELAHWRLHIQYNPPGYVWKRLVP